VATPWTADSLVRDYRVDSAKIAVVGFGANVVCKPTTKDWNSPTFLWVGVDWLRKGGDLLLEAFLRAKIPNATLHLVGAHPDISVRSVCGHGIVRDEARLRELFEMATVFVMPSRFEAAGIVFVEAASAGTPSIGTTVGGIPHMIGPAGECVPPEDVEELTSALRRMADPDIVASFAVAAVAHARENTWTAVSQRMIDAVVSLDPDSSVGSSQAGPNP
jgi:glycosyltransferase involved in cell wall biosynthesis